MYEWYSDLEARLEEVIRVAPFVHVDQAASIHSPRLASVHLEAASLVDTLFRSQLSDPFKRPNSKETPLQRANIEDYRRLLNPELMLESRKSLLLLGVPSLLCPFDSWRSPKTDSLDWWRKYNDLKHDRLRSAANISLLDCIQALCALNQLMLSLDGVVQLVFRFGWADLAGYNPANAKGELRNRALRHGFIAYTRFFAFFLNSITFTSVESIRPIEYRNNEKLAAHLGRLGTEAEGQ